MAYAPTEKLTPFLWRKAKEGNPGAAYYLHWCPACKRGHSYPIGGVAGPHNWQFNGNIEEPSFAPSMRIFIPAGPYGDNDEMVAEQTVCHYYLTDGKIIYQNDCHHDRGFAGKTVPLEPIPDNYGF
jgi:hypothetical protein